MKKKVYFSVVKHMFSTQLKLPFIQNRLLFSLHNEHKVRMEARVSLLICIVVTDRSNSEIQ